MAVADRCSRIWGLTPWLALILAGCGGGAFAETGFGTEADAESVFEIEVTAEGCGARTPVLERQTLIVLPGREERVECLRTYRYVGGADGTAADMEVVETEIELGVRLRLAVTEAGDLDWSAKWNGLQGRPRFVRFEGVDIELPSIVSARASGRMPGEGDFRLVLPSPWPGDRERIVLRGGGREGGIEVAMETDGDSKRFLLPEAGPTQAWRNLDLPLLNDFDVEIAQSAGPFINARPVPVRSGLTVEFREADQVRVTFVRLDRIEELELPDWPTLELPDLTIERKRLHLGDSPIAVSLPSGPGGRPNSLSIRRVSR